MAAIQGEIHLRVDPRDGGQRLDAYLSQRWGDGCSRSQAALWIRQGVILVDGVHRKPSYRIQPGEVVRGHIPPPAETFLTPEPIPLSILFEDHDVIVIDKPPGLVVHPAAGHASGTLVNGLLHHCPDLEGIGGERRPGIVHRLDKDTSGVMVVAKNAMAHQSLARHFKLRQIHKKYLAIVVGVPSQPGGRIELSVGRHPVERKKMAAGGPRGRPAITLWQVGERFQGAALLVLELKTGRTHQIRVHCQSMGHPIVGDPLYGQKRSLQRLARNHAALWAVFKQARRQMLHAASLSFIHPVSGQMMTFEAQMPEDMATVMTGLRQIED